jgi:Asp/Glu/hydantoin racemase
MPLAIQPVRDAFRAIWPEAETSNLLDDDLTHALKREGGISPAVTARICDLARYAARMGVDGILFSCSAFAPAIDLAKQLVSIPVLKPDEAMVEAALDAGRRIGVVATFPGTPPITTGQLNAAAAARAASIEIHTLLVDGAMAALAAGDATTHDRLIVEAAVGLDGTVDALCLAQFSMARAQADVQRRIKAPVLTSPTSAVDKLKKLLA